MPFLNYKDLQILWKKVRLPVLLLVCSFFGGSFGYKLLYPEESWSRIFFMTAITISTVGYADVLGVEESAYGSWYTMLLIVIGMGLVLYSISVLTAFIVEGNLGKLFLERRMEQQIAKLNQHYIICGAGQTGIHVIREIQETEHPFVVVDSCPGLRKQLNEEFPGILLLDGDATSDETLLLAGIKHARGLVAALASDKDNLFLTLSARMLNPKIAIVSRAIDLSIKRKLVKAGASYIVSPNHIGGLRMASEILRPHVVTFLDRMLRGKDPVRIEEVTVCEGSQAVGKNLQELAIPKKTGLLVIALSGKEDPHNLIYNPGPEEVLSNGSTLYFIGNPKQRTQLEKLLA